VEHGGRAIRKRLIVPCVLSQLVAWASIMGDQCSERGTRARDCTNEFVTAASTKKGRENKPVDGGFSGTRFARFGGNNGNWCLISHVLSGGDGINYLRSPQAHCVERQGMHDIKKLLIPALVLGYLTIYCLREYRRSRRRTAIAQGKVLRVRFGRLHLGTNVPRPEIEFVDSRGQRVGFHSRIGTSSNPWPRGSTVQVFYDPEDPTNAEIKPTRTIVLYFVGTGLFFVFVFGLLIAFGN
jgi:hypothetical protein